MPDPSPTTPAPPPAAPAPPAPAPTTSPAGDIAARMRAAAGLPPKEAPAVPPKAAPSAAAPPAGTPPAPTTPPAPDKPLTEEKPGEPKKSDGQLALEFVREQKARQAAETRVRELEERLKTGDAEAAPVKTAKEKWQAGKFADAIREAFGVKNFSDDFLVQLAQADAEPEPLTPEQLKEQIRQQLRDEMKAEQDARTAELEQLREQAVTEVAETLTKAPDRWPTVWRLGVTGAQIAAAMDASFDPRTGRTGTPEQIFDQLEKDYRATVEGLPYWKRDAAAEPPPPAPAPPAAPRSFGAESRRGPVPTAEAPKPQTAEERWAARRKAEEEWRAKTFARPGN